MGLREEIRLTSRSLKRKSVQAGREKEKKRTRQLESLRKKTEVVGAKAKLAEQKARLKRAKHSGKKKLSIKPIKLKKGTRPWWDI